MKMILIFDKDSKLLKQIQYKTKGIAKGNYNLFKKFGYQNWQTGEKIEGCTFELI